MTLLDDIGGDDSLVALVNRFYDLVETLPEGATLRRLHGRGHGIAHARIEQVDFMSGFLGGRQHYRERHGHMDVKWPYGREANPCPCADPCPRRGKLAGLYGCRSARRGSCWPAHRETAGRAAPSCANLGERRDRLGRDGHARH